MRTHHGGQKHQAAKWPSRGAAYLEEDDRVAILNHILVPDKAHDEVSSQARYYSATRSAV